MHKQGETYEQLGNNGKTINYCLPIARTRLFGGVCVAHLFSFVLSYYVSLRSELCVVRYDFRIATMFGSFLPPVVCRRARVLFMLSVLVCAYWCPTHIVFVFFFLVLCVLCCLTFI